MTPPALTIAGSDPSGGAGIQADLKTFHRAGVYGMSVVTLITVQNTESVQRVQLLSPDLVLDQLLAVLSDIPPHAIKTGALGGPEIVDAVCMRSSSFSCPFVVDPVMISKHGNTLLDPDGIELMKKRLIPTAYLVTPNIPEAQILSERDITSVKGMEQAATTIRRLGVKNVLIKGGHLEDGSATDVLLLDGALHRFPAPRIETVHTHGTGCAYSAAITALLARRVSLGLAVKTAKNFITNAIATAPGFGHGQGPINLFADME